ncbi:biopolymer transporter ExbD [Methylococcus sp. EFPC2]|uniref:ExbD/TolR family protein n=1 Tax=Methylococcus sp. EFPC2 TaxID=2812648 RepID=UPI001966FAB3|nr:biopolymer transporter ExbD [Methylococcus sp. EFPC2]QSA96934.1 biopolymer transporter ExbD [Methylococcus sp. EFPC2]
MAFGSFNPAHGGTRPMNEINMVPLIDVMLVLLIIFMITAPLLSHQVKIDLPKASSHPASEETDHVELAIDDAGRFFWNGEGLDRAALKTRLAEAALKQPQPELHLRADKATAYQILAEVLADAASAGVTRIGFVSDPREARP